MSAFKDRRARIESPVCGNCGSEDIVLDPKQGQLVCQDCGTIRTRVSTRPNNEQRPFFVDWAVINELVEAEKAQAAEQSGGSAP